jgi:hypothetical protein
VFSIDAACAGCVKPTTPTTKADRVSNRARLPFKPRCDFIIPPPQELKIILNQIKKNLQQTDYTA